jgi:hypothetical protein
LVVPQEVGFVLDVVVCVNLAISKVGTLCMMGLHSSDPAAAPPL